MQEIYVAFTDLYCVNFFKKMFVEMKLPTFNVKGEKTTVFIQIEAILE